MHGKLVGRSAPRSCGTAGVSTRCARPPLRYGPSGDTPPAPRLGWQLWALRPGLDACVPTVHNVPGTRRATELRTPHRTGTAGSGLGSGTAGSPAGGAGCAVSLCRRRVDVLTEPTGGPFSRGRRGPFFSGPSCLPVFNHPSVRRTCIARQGDGGAVSRRRAEAGGRAPAARPVSLSPPIEPGAHRLASPELPDHEDLSRTGKWAVPPAPCWGRGPCPSRDFVVLRVHLRAPAHRPALNHPSSKGARGGGSCVPAPCRSRRPCSCRSTCFLVPAHRAWSPSPCLTRTSRPRRPVEDG